MTERQDALEAIRREPDVSVLVVGGGIVGAGLFRDLALQGIDCLLVDRGDFSSGTSAGPSRMVHGGLRYLEFGEFRLVREAVRERNLLLRNAPHYIRPLPTTIPIVSWVSGLGSVIKRMLGLGGKRPPHRGALLVKIGLTIYDIYGRRHRSMPRHRFATRRRALARRPLLLPETIWTATYYDAWVSYPERLCLELLLDGEALCPEARALSYVSLRGARADGVTLRDELTGDEFDVRPKILVNATGAWVDFTNRLLGHETRMIDGTKGAHLVLDNDELVRELGGEMIFYETPDGRATVALPWLGKALIGSTDIRVSDPDKVRCEEDEIEYMLQAIRVAFPRLRVDRSQILSFFSGVRPMAASDASQTGQMSRAHRCNVIAPTDGTPYPIHCMVGGKWTPFRIFAEHVADGVLEHLGRPRRAGSDLLAIGGGRGYPRGDRARRRWAARLEGRTGLPEGRLLTLLERYGTRAERVAAFCVEGSDRPLGHHEAYTVREI
ncbi:MAG: glycerol-3-phosphate dehydrogenase/oxidase, partial [Planctomycetota bacterium]